MLVLEYVLATHLYAIWIAFFVDAYPLEFINFDQYYKTATHRVHLVVFYNIREKGNYVSKERWQNNFEW
jgi:hypothetical protein